MNLKLLISELETLEEIELKEYNTSPYKQVNSIIEYIGNKWVLHSGSNIRTGNKEFKVKKDIYNDTKYIKIPTNHNELIGLDNYQQFGYKEILERSLIILHGITEDFHNSWDDIY